MSIHNLMSYITLVLTCSMFAVMFQYPEWALTSRSVRSSADANSPVTKLSNVGNTDSVH